MKFTSLRPSDLIVRNIEVSVRRVSALCASVMNEGCFYSTLLNSISSNPYRLHWWSLSVLLSVLDFLSLVLVESEWLVVYLFTLFREFKMSPRRQQQQRQKSNRLRLCSHYSMNSIGPGRHKSFTHIETSRRRGWPRGFGALNSSPHSRIFTFVSVGSTPRSYLFISATGRIVVHTAP